MIDYFENLSEADKRASAVYIPELYLILGYAHYYQHKNYVEALALFDKEIVFYDTYNAGRSIEWIEDNYINVSQIMVEYYQDDIPKLRNEFKNLYNLYHPQVADLDGDGRREIVIPYFDVGEIGGHDEHTGFIIYDKIGESREYTMYKHKIEEDPYTKITLKDVDQDGKIEIILAPIMRWADYREYYRFIYQYDGQGGVTKIGEEKLSREETILLRCQWP